MPKSLANLNLDPFRAAVAQFDLSAIRAQVEAMPDIEGGWPAPASLSRFGVTQMPWKMHRRFMSYVEPYNMGYKPEPDSVWYGFDEPCWLWGGGLHDKGYGRFWLGKDPEDGTRIYGYTHRIAFEHWVGFPKAGYIVDHECNVKTCCNPVHLWPLTNEENIAEAYRRRPWQHRNQYSKE